MDDEQLLTFLTISELNNYSKTADVLNLTQPAVTARIQKLEMELGCKLFNRDGKKIILTEEGRTLLPFARKIINYVVEVKQSIEQLKSPTLTIGLSPGISSSIILQVLSLVRERNDFLFEIVELKDSEEGLTLVKNGLVEIALVRDLIPLTDLESNIICPEKLVFIVGKEHPLAAKAVINKDDLSNQTIVYYGRKTVLWKKVNESLIGIKNLKRIEVGGFEMLKSMIKYNWGFTIIPELALQKDMIKLNENFRTIPFGDFENLTFNFTGIYKKETPKLEMVLKFLHFFDSTLKEYTNDLEM